MTTFAKISIQEIQALHQKKASALEIIIYQAIASHIHSDKKNNAFPSLRRIQSLIGGMTHIQSITRAITSLARKGLISKGKVRSKDRFILIFRPFKNLKKNMARTLKHAKHFVNTRFSIQTKPSRFNTKPNGLHNRNTQSNKSNNLFKRGEDNENINEFSCDAESVFQDFVLDNPDRNISKLSKGDFHLIKRCLTSDIKADVEWREIMRWSEKNTKTFDAILAYEK